MVLIFRSPVNTVRVHLVVYRLLAATYGWSFASISSQLAKKGEFVLIEIFTHIFVDGGKGGGGLGGGDGGGDGIGGGLGSIGAPGGLGGGLGLGGAGGRARRLHFGVGVVVE